MFMLVPSFVFLIWLPLVLCSYAPRSVNCPQHRLIRKSSRLSPRESKWLQARDLKTKHSLTQWLTESGLEGFDPAGFMANSTVRIAVAVSGGGYRAMLTGAGILAAMDDRTPASLQTGHLGGLLQSTTYLAGLSGASFLVTSLAMEHFQPVVELQASREIWNFDHEFFLPGGDSLRANFHLWSQTVGSVGDKKALGFPTSLTDYYGRMYAYQLFSGNHSGMGWSSVAEYPEFIGGDMPMPIVLSVGRNPGELFIDNSSIIYEMTPLEFGSWDPDLYHFVDMKYLGSDLLNGHPVGQCIENFDNVAFVTASSTTFFNAALTDLVGWDKMPQFIRKYILQEFHKSPTKFDVALIEPNPFRGLEDCAFAQEPSLELVDGGEDNQSIPLYPFIQPHRKVDLVFALDLTATTFSDSPLSTYSPSGRAMVASYLRQFDKQANKTIFPYVPDDTTFVWGGMINQPTFFGCDVNNLTSLFDPSLPTEQRFYPPLMVYIGNSEHSFNPYFNTFKSKYDQGELANMIENGYNIMTQNNGTIDSEWRTCLACATVLREQQRRNVSPTDQCLNCFKKYCWDGKLHIKDDGKGDRSDGKTNLVRK